MTYRVLIYFILFGIFFKIFPQEAAYNKTSLSINEKLELKVALKSEKIKYFQVSPKFEDFDCVDSATRKHHVTFIYKPKLTGTYSLPASKFKVNNTFIEIPATIITVFNYSAFNNFFKTKDKNEDDNYVKENVQVPNNDDYFFNLEFSKNEVVVNEGIHTKLNLYIEHKKLKKVDFHEFESTYPLLIKQLHPQHCLETIIPIETIAEQKVKINGKKYIKFKLFEAIYYPLKAEKICFKAFNSAILHHKDQPQKIISLKTSQACIQVKNLASTVYDVGVFSLKEYIQKTHLKFNESVKYVFQISGTGNIQNLSKPLLHTITPELEIFEISSKKDARIVNGQQQGTITYEYQLVLKSDKKIRIADYISWKFYNTQSSKTDSLKSRITLVPTGTNFKNEQIANNHTDDFYKLIESQSTNLTSIDSKDNVKKWANIGFIIMLSFTLLLIFKKNKKAR